KDYVTVNFNQLADIVDAVGGVTLTLTAAEVNSANQNMAESFPSDPRLSGSGEMVLTGPQAVSYARIRNIDSDNARADRQQQVLKAIFAKIQTMPKSDYPSFIREFLSITETSLGYGDLLALSPIMLKSNLTFNQYVVPDEHENPTGGTASDGVWYWIYDLNAAGDRIHSIIY
ncbi:MAG: LCP family protein, partial [Bacillota bacterium]|nr:LCP family protein [Bacillota bacterium]